MTPQSKTAEPDTDTTDVPLSDAWVPVAPGQILVGEVVEVSRGWSDYKNGYYPLLRIRKDDGEVKAFHAFRTVAMGQVLDKRPVTGERVKITYLGARPPKPGETTSPPVGYRLEIEGRGAEADQATYDAMDMSRNVAIGGNARGQEQPADPVAPDPAGADHPL